MCWEKRGGTTVRLVLLTAANRQRGCVGCESKCKSLHVCEYACIIIYMYIQTYICIYVYLMHCAILCIGNINVGIYIYISVYIHMYVCVYVCVNMCVYVVCLPRPVTRQDVDNNNNDNNSAQPLCVSMRVCV